MTFLPLFTVAAALQVALTPNIPVKYVAPVPSGETVLATVNGQPILAKDMASLLWEWRSPEVGEDLISLAVLRQAAQKAGVSANQAEIEKMLRVNLNQAAINKAKNKNDPSPSTPVEQELAMSGFPMSRLYLRSEAEVLLDKITLKDFKSEDFVRISTIAFQAAPNSPVGFAEAMKKADAAYAKLRSGTAWNAVVSESGMPPDALKNGGLLGWRSVTLFPGDLATTLPKMKAGEITKPAKTATGYQIFRVEQAGSQAIGADLDELKNEFALRGRQATLQAVMKDAKITRSFPKAPGQ